MNPWIETTGWTLIHFVWQGTLLALATAAALGLCRRSTAQVRYVVACLGLTSMLVTAAATAVRARFPPVLAPSLPIDIPPAGRLGSPIEASIAAAGNCRSPRAQRFGKRLDPEQLLQVVVWLWLAGVTVLMARLAGGMLADPSPEGRDHRGAALVLAAGRRTTGPAPARQRAVPDRRVGRGRRADPDRLVAAAGHTAARRDGADDRGTGRGARRPRAGAHPPPRLRDQPAADDGRSAVVLPPGRLVGLAAHSPGTRALLRRCRHRRRGGGDGVRGGADGAGVLARARVSAVAGSRERSAPAPDSPAPQPRRRARAIGPWRACWCSEPVSPSPRR